MDKGKGKGKEKEEDNEASSGQRESGTGVDINDWIRDLEWELNIESPKLKEREGRSGSTKAKPTAMSKEQIDLVYQLCRERIAFQSIVTIMGVRNGEVDLSDLKRVILEAEASIAEEQRMQDLGEDLEGGFEEEAQDETQSQGDEDLFEPYDPVKWATATEEKIIEEAPDEDKAPGPHPFEHIDEAISKMNPPPGTPNSENLEDSEDEEEEEEEELSRPPSPEQDFVRALKASQAGTKPYYRKGDILRVINKAQRRDLDDHYFELLPLKPPGEAGPALIRDFEHADREAVDEVGREARTAKESHCFQYAIEWED